MRSDLETIAARAAQAGIRRVHALAWRDLDDPTAGGSEIHANEILTRWAAAGVDVTIHAGRVDHGDATVQRDGVTVLRRGGPFTSWVAGPRSVLRHLDREHDAILEIWHGVNFLAPFWSRVPTVGIFHHVHTEQFHQVLPPGASHVAAFLERRVYPRLYRGRPLIALSQSVRQEMVDVLGWEPSSVHVVEPGVADRFVPGAPRSSTPLVLSVGRFMPQKGFVAAVDVLAEVKRRCPELRAVIVGDGPERGNIEERIRIHDAQSWIQLPGRIDDDALLDLYQRSWVLLSTSWREGWGMTVTEAGACETPSVVTDITGHREAVVDGETGFVRRDVATLSAALAELVADDATRIRMGKAAARHAATHRWDATARRVFDVLADEALRLRDR